MDEYLLPKIADFGLSKIQHTNSESMSIESFNGLKGSPVYMSPEIMLRYEYSPACDVYAFGIIVYEIITTEELFKDCTLFVISSKVINGIRPEIDKTVPDSYRNLIKRCWAQNPKDRPTFDEIVEELKTNEGYITELVEKEDFYDYINYIENCKKTFDSIEKIIKIDQFIKQDSKTFKKVSDINNEALKFKNEADNGDPEAMNIYANMLRKGHGVKCNKIEAAKYSKMAADKGNSEAMHNYALMCYLGDGIPADKSVAARYFKMAADNGDSEAMFNYGVILYNGEGIPSDKSEAARYYKMSADNGNSNAMFIYAQITYKGDGIPEDQSEAARYFKMSADKGHSEAMFYYAYILSEGKGISVNKSEAARYYKMSVDKGNPGAMYNYALMLKDGEGIPANKNEAARYYKMSADKENSNSIQMTGHWKWPKIHDYMIYILLFLLIYLFLNIY